MGQLQTQSLRTTQAKRPTVLGGYILFGARGSVWAWGKHGPDFGGRLRSAKEIALHLSVAFRTDHIELLLCLHPFRRD